MIFVFPFLYVMYYIHSFVNIISSLPSWGESHLTMEYGFLNVFLDVVGLYFFRRLASMFISDIGLYFSFFIVSLSCLGLG